MQEGKKNLKNTTEFIFGIPEPTTKTKGGKGFLELEVSGNTKKIQWKHQIYK